MTPILYSFRRCPYAMRARLAIASAGVETELREIVLREKPQPFLEASPSATVPCLVLGDLTAPDNVIDESLDIMKWALAINDPDNWLDVPKVPSSEPSGTRAAGGSELAARQIMSGEDWIKRADGPFKEALDRTKYASRYPDIDSTEHRDIAAKFLVDLDQQITTWIFDTPTIADFAILPFIRQFAFIDKDWFDAQAWPNLHAWLDHFLKSEAFAQIMDKYPQWQEGDAPTRFP